MNRLGLGCARLGSVGGGIGWRESVRLVHAAVDHGVCYFDTADAYGAGSSERILGRALRGRRNDVVVATKGGYRFTERSSLQQFARTTAGAVLRRVRTRVPINAGRGAAGGYVNQDFSPGYLTSALEGSLRRLGTDHIDVYQLHGPRDADREAIAEWADKMVAAGKVGRLGIGAEDLDQAREWLSCVAVESLQVPFGVLGSEAGADVIPAAHASGRSVVARGVLGAGLLAAPRLAVGSDGTDELVLIQRLRAVAADAGVGIAAVAVGYVAARTDVDTIVVGTSSRAHLAELAAIAAAPGLDPAVLAMVDATVAA